MIEDTKMLVKLLRDRFSRVFISDPLRPYKYETLDRRLKSQAAVLVLLERRGNEWYTFFTVRSPDLRLFGGETSFPGGRREQADQSPVETALRESQEETGLDPSSVHIIGTLRPLFSVQQCLIYPVIGLLTGEFLPSPNPSEVERCFWAPTRRFLGNEIHLGSFPVWGIRMHKFRINDELVSGLTANLIVFISMLIHQRRTEFQFGNETEEDQEVEEIVLKHFAECHSLIKHFKEEKSRL